MKLVVHLADFGWPVEADELARLLGDVGELTEAGGFDGIAVGDRTCAFAFDVDDGAPATRELIGQLQWLADLGVDTVIGRVDGLEQRTPVELLARHVVPVVAELPTRRGSDRARKERTPMNEIDTFLSP